MVGVTIPNLRGEGASKCARGGRAPHPLPRNFLSTQPDVPRQMLRVRACVIFNPTARGDKARKFRRHLETIGSQMALKPTPSAGSARTLAAESVEEGFDTLIAAGGDGTVNEVLNGIGDARDGFKRARLAVLPLGTVNVFARELGLPLRLDRSWTTLQAGREIVIDLPWGEFQSEGKQVRRYFAQMAGAGLDSSAIARVSWALKKRIGQGAYILAGFQALMQSQPRVEVLNGPKPASGELILVGNGRFYAGSLPIFRAANFQDGALDVCIFPRVNWFQVLRYGLGFVFNRVPGPCSETHLQASSFTLEATPGAALQMDGELVGQLPVHFGLVPRTLRVVAP
jgi:diacylglycerol kinase (ATP)